MAKRKLKGIDRVERAYKICEYLRYNTDQTHTTSRQQLSKDKDYAEYVGDKQTFNRLIKDLAQAMNRAEYGFKEEENWKIVFDDFREYANSDAEEMPTMTINHLYYQPLFSHKEIDALVDGILASKTIDSESAQTIIDKILGNLVNKFYENNLKQIYKVKEPQLVDRNQLSENIKILQEAIGNNVKVEFQFNGYTHRKTLEPVRKEKYTVNPYYVVANNGRYYLIAAMNYKIDANYEGSMSIWRIDLMTDIVIPGKKEKLEIKGEPKIPVRRVKNLPQKWDDTFQLKHLNMSFDDPVMVTLKIKSLKKEDTKQRLRPDYTFMHDWFGDNYTFKRIDEDNPENDIVTVECSPYGMVNWALQYSDRVEVVSPKEVRDMVEQRIEDLMQKYQKK